MALNLIGTKLVNKQNKPINAIGKMMVINRGININLAQLLLDLNSMGITSTIIYSINLRDDLKVQVFSKESGNLSITYVEIGIRQFMDILNANSLGGGR